MSHLRRTLILSILRTKLQTCDNHLCLSTSYFYYCYRSLRSARSKSRSLAQYKYLDNSLVHNQFLTYTVTNRYHLSGGVDGLNFLKRRYFHLGLNNKNITNKDRDIYQHKDKDKNENNEKTNQTIRYIYPEKLPIYWAGKKVVLLGGLMMLTLFQAVFAVGVLGRGTYLYVLGEGAIGEGNDNNDGDNNNTESTNTSSSTGSNIINIPIPIIPWDDDSMTITMTRKTLAILAAMGVCLIGSIPYVLMRYFGSPYVTHVHLRIPGKARLVGNKEYVLSWIRRQHNSTSAGTGAGTTAMSRPTRTYSPVMMDITTLNKFGRLKSVGVGLDELRMERRRLGCVNLLWEKSGNGERKEKGFYVDEEGSVVDGDIFRELMRVLKEREGKRRNV